MSRTARQEMFLQKGSLYPHTLMYFQARLVVNFSCGSRTTLFVNRNNNFFVCLFCFVLFCFFFFKFVTTLTSRYSVIMVIINKQDKGDLPKCTPW